MNRWLVENVEPPPIVDFKGRAREITPDSHRIFDMSQAVPSLPTPMVLRRRLAEDLVADPGLSFYTDVPGLLALREQIALRHPLRGGLSPENVVVTAGANHAMFTAYLVHFKAGDRVVLPEPYYFNYDMGLRMLGMEPVGFRLESTHGFILEARAMKSFLAETRPQGVILISPNNPTGAIYPAAEVVELLEWTSVNGVEVILDETYARYDPNHLNDHALVRFVGRGLTIVGSFSKTYSLTGYRVGYLAAGLDVIREAQKVQDTLVICAPHLSQVAAYYGLEFCEPDLARLLATTADLTERLRFRASELRRFRLASSGAFFAYVEHPLRDLDCTAAALEIYRRTGILGLPGTVFGPSQGEFVRLAFCNLSPEDLDAAMDGLLAFDHSI